MADISTRISIYANDQASEAFRRVGREAESLASRLSQLGPNLQKALVGLGAGIGLSDALQQAADYETAVKDMARVTERSFDQVRADVAGVPSEFGTQTELMRGYYAVMSAGVTDATQALDLLTVAAQGGKAAHVSQAQTITALTKLMAGYAGEIKNATEASDLLFAIERQGQTTFSELVPVIGDAAAISKQARVSADEMGATLAAMTQTAGGTAQAVTQYRAVLMSLIKPQQTMSATLADMGYTSGVALIRDKGLSGALTALAEQARKSGVEMGKLFESSEAMTALGPLLATNFARVSSNMESMRAKSGATQRAFEEWKTSLNGLKEQTANLFGDLSIAGGNLVAPEAAAALSGLNTGLRSVLENFDTVTTAAGALITGFVAMTAAQKIATSETLKFNYAVLTGKAVLLDSSKASLQKALAAKEEAAATLQSAQAAATDATQQLAAARARLQNAVSMRQVRQAQAAEINALRLMLATGNSVTAAEMRLAAATDAAAAASKRASIAGRALAGIRAGASGLISLMGGPWVAGFTVAAVAVYGIHSAMQKNRELLDKYRQGLSDVADAAEQSGKKITALDQAMARTARETAARELEKAQADLAAIKHLTEDTERGGGALTYIASTKERYFGYDEGTLKASAAIRDYQKGVIDAYEAQKRLIELREQFGRTESIENALAWIDALIGSLKATDDAGRKLDDTNARLNDTEKAAQNAASGVEDLAAAMALLGKQDVTPAASLDAAIKSLREYTKTTKSAKTEAVKAARETADANLEQIRLASERARAAGKTTEADALAAEWRTQKGRVGEVKDKTGSRGASGADNARRSLQALDAEIAKLKGTGESFDAQLARKLSEIAKTGKAAGLSLAQITAKQQEYAAAANADNQRKYNDAIRDLDISLAQLNGDTQQARFLESAKEVEELTRRFAAFGPVTDEARAKIEALTAARQRQSEIKDATAAAGFYKELYEMAGQFGQAQEYNNELIRLQGENLRQNVGVSQELIDQWVKLKQLDAKQDFMSGAKRGLVKFGSEYGNIAKQVESATQSMGSTIASTLSDAFMTGEFSAKKFFNSLISSAAQAMSNFFVGSLFKGIGMSFGFGVAHAGAVVGQTALPMRAAPPGLFADAPRYHRGGPILAPDEVPIIAQTGERVLTREQNAAWERGQRGASGPISLTVALENKSGQPLQTSQSQTRWSADMRSAVVSIVLDAVQRNYMGARDALKP